MNYSTINSYSRSTLFLVVLLVAAAVGLPQGLCAQISVSSVLVHFQSTERPVHNITVSNSATAPLYVTVNVEQVLEPGVEGGKAEESEDILVSPRRFSVPGSGQRTVRLLLRNRPGPEDQERVYRVIFSPEERGFGESDIGTEKLRQGTIIRVLTGMGVLVFVDPPNASSKLSWEREGSKITFTNNGNLHVRLLNGKACVAEDKCEDLRVRRVYGGREYQVTVPENATVTYNLREGTSGEYQTISIPPENG